MTDFCLAQIKKPLNCPQYYSSQDGGSSFIQMKVMNRYMFTHKKEIWSVNFG